MRKVVPPLIMAILIIASFLKEYHTGYKEVSAMAIFYCGLLSCVVLDYLGKRGLIGKKRNDDLTVVVLEQAIYAFAVVAAFIVNSDVAVFIICWLFSKQLDFFKVTLYVRNIAFLALVGFDLGYSHLQAHGLYCGDTSTIIVASSTVMALLVSLLGSRVSFIAVLGVLLITYVVTAMYSGQTFVLIPALLIAGELIYRTNRMSLTERIRACY